GYVFERVLDHSVSRKDDSHIVAEGLQRCRQTSRDVSKADHLSQGIGLGRGEKNLHRMPGEDATVLTSTCFRASSSEPRTPMPGPPDRPGYSRRVFPWTSMQRACRPLLAVLSCSCFTRTYHGSWAMVAGPTGRRGSTRPPPSVTFRSSGS